MKYSSEEIENSVEDALRRRKKALEIAKTTEIEDYQKFLLSSYHAEMSEEEYAEMIRQIYKELPKYPFKGNWTTAEKSKILNDWLFFFPDLARRKPKTVLKRLVGPLCLSLSFKMTTSMGADYKVYYSIHNLTYISDYMISGLSSIPLDIMYFYEHEAKYKKYVEKAKTEAFVPLSGPVTLDDVFAGYNKAARRPYEVRVPTLVAAWAGEPEKAQEYLEWGRNKLIGDQTYLGLKLQEIDKWYEEHQKLIANPEVLRANARAEAKKFKLEFAPYQDIVGVPYQPGGLFDK